MRTAVTDRALAIATAIHVPGGSDASLHDCLRVLLDSGNVVEAAVRDNGPHCASGWFALRSQIPPFTPPTVPAQIQCRSRALYWLCSFLHS